MNQIPNIEETHNTREIAGRVDDFYLQFCHEVNGKIKFDFDDAEIVIKWIQNNLQEMQDTLHQQLQKAREEAYKQGKIDAAKDVHETKISGLYIP